MGVQMPGRSGQSGIMLHVNVEKMPLEANREIAGEGLMGEAQKTPASATMVVKLGYRGAGFVGYAAQPGKRSVAGEVQGALETFLRRPVELECAGRTDAGVNALAQHVSLPLYGEETGLEGGRIMRALSALTPDDISIRGIYRARPGFSARFDAESRTYRYRIADGATRPVLAWDHAWWHRSPLDASRMDEAAQVLLGEHDFASFCKTDSCALLRSEGRSTSRCIEKISVSRTEEADEELVLVEVTGNAFLHNMVRIIVGTLAEVGRGHRPPLWVAEALSACDRRAAGPTAPAEGLTFARVAYPEGALEIWR